MTAELPTGQAGQRISEQIEQLDEGTLWNLSAQIREKVERATELLERVANRKASPQNTALYEQQVLPLARIGAQFQEALEFVTSVEARAGAPVAPEAGLTAALVALDHFVAENHGFFLQTLESLPLGRKAKAEVYDLLNVALNLRQGIVKMEEKGRRKSGGMSRRALLARSAAIPFGVSAAVSIGVEAGFRSVPTPAVSAEPLLGESDEEVWEEGGLTENLVESFRTVYGELTRDQIVFVDQNGNVIEGPIELESYVFPEDANVIGIDMREPVRAADFKFPVVYSYRKEDFITPPFEENVGKMNQEWLNKWRRVLKARYPGLDLRLEKDQELPKMFSHSAKLREVQAAPDETYFDIALRNSEIKVAETGKTKLEFAREVFRSETSLPQVLQDTIIFGLCGVESAFDGEAESEKGAKGEWQFMEDTAREYDLIRTETRIVNKPYSFRRKGKLVKGSRKRKEQITIDDRGDFIKATHTAAKRFNYLYQKFLRDGEVQKLRERFYLNEADIVFPCVINAYHSGRTRIRQVLKWFLKGYSPERVEKKLGKGPYGRDLYTFMTEEALLHKAVKRYGNYSREYYFKVQALSDLLQLRQKEAEEALQPEQVEESYIPPEAPPHELAAMMWRNRLGIAAVLAGTAVGVGAEKIFTPGDTVWERIRYKRRDLLAAAAGGFGSTAAVGIMSRIHPSREVLFTPATEPEPPFQLRQSEELGKHLLEMNFISAAELRELEEAGYKNVATPRKQQPKITTWLNSFELDSKYESPTRFRTERQVLRMVEQGILVPLDPPETCLTYRIRGLGREKDPARIGLEGNHPNFVFTRPHLKDLLEVISKRFNAELREKLHFPENLTVRFMVNSATRPTNYKVSGSRNSAHYYGLALDLNPSLFEVVDPEEKTFYRIPDSSRSKPGIETWGINNKYRQLNEFCGAALARVLLKMHEDKEIVFMEEGKDHHGHITPLAKEPFLK